MCRVAVLHHLHAHGPRDGRARNILCAACASEGQTIRLGAFDRRSFDGARRQRRSFHWLEVAYDEHSGVLQWIGVPSRISRAPFDARFPHLLQRISASHDTIFKDHRDNAIRDYRSERPESLHPQSWSKATTRDPEWPHCKNYRLLLRPNER